MLPSFFCVIEIYESVFQLLLFCFVFCFVFVFVFLVFFFFFFVFFFFFFFCCFSTFKSLRLISECQIIRGCFLINPAHKKLISSIFCIQESPNKYKNLLHWHCLLFQLTLYRNLKCFQICSFFSDKRRCCRGLSRKQQRR